MNQCKSELFLSFLCFRREVIGQEVSSVGYNVQWPIQGRGLGAPPPLFLDQSEPQRAKKNFLRLPPSLYLRVWMTAPSPLSEDLDPPLMSVQSVYLPAVGYT